MGDAEEFNRLADRVESFYSRIVWRAIGLIFALVSLIGLLITVLTAKFEMSLIRRV